MKETIRMIVTVTVFCVASGFLLAWTNSVTKTPIENARKAELIAALKKVLPKCDNDVMADVKVINDNGKAWTFYVARLEDAYVGAAFTSTSENGYGGPSQVLVGVLPDATINAVEVLSAEKETPGLGSKVKEAGFRNQFKGRSGRDTRWAAVIKDGGEIQAITGATISSRAVTEAVKAGLDVLVKHAKGNR